MKTYIFPKLSLWKKNQTVHQVVNNLNWLFYVSSTDGNQNAILVQAEANIMYFGLNCTHWTGPGWSALRTHTL